MCTSINSYTGLAFFEYIIRYNVPKHFYTSSWLETCLCSFALKTHNCASVNAGAADFGCQVLCTLSQHMYRQQ